MLPAEGCDLPAPKLPPGRRWAQAERRLWKELWASPQAVQWDDSAASVVASYIVLTLAVLGGTAAAWQAAEARHLADRLGLTPTGMASLGWRIAERGEVADVVPLRVS
uniref:hypothetical protein n=1 Tax=Kribbella turkmenica TaxID=2530375 RepID=UPI00192D861B|nr:hypothetical protein [Kribbella turkmenica]